MNVFVRLICTLALLAFAIGVVAHSAGSAAMAATMVTADVSATEMGDCDACGDPEAGLAGVACDFACNATGVAAIPAVAPEMGRVAKAGGHERLPERVSRGITGPAAKAPPRSHL